MINNLRARRDAGQFHGHHRAELVATSGQVCRPPVGRSRWPLTLVWDLTSKGRVEHVAKTTLYAEILAKDGVWTRVMETYWSGAPK
jgi:hypothetical protein